MASSGLITGPGTPDVVTEIDKIGEERARRAGLILDVSKDGYYTAEKCVPDFIKVRSL